VSSFYTIIFRTSIVIVIATQQKCRSAYYFVFTVHYHLTPTHKLFLNVKRGYMSMDVTPKTNSYYRNFSHSYRLPVEIWEIKERTDQP